MNPFFILVLLCTAIFPVAAHADQKPVFGPKKYDVVERYGPGNRYTETFEVPEGNYVIQLMNGENLAQRSDYIEFKVNGETLLHERMYDYRYLACFVKLKKQNTFELVLRDYKPTGFRRPPPTPKNVTVTIMPASIGLDTVSFGIPAWNRLDQFTGTVLKIRSPESRALALGAASFGSETGARVAAMKKLAERKDPDAMDFLLTVHGDYADTPDVRGEAASALGFLGDRAAVPALIQGLLDPQEKVRIGSAHALGLYREEEIREQLISAFEGMDSMMRAGVIKTSAATGWKPVNTLIELAGSTDPALADFAIELLSGSKDERVFALLLTYLETPGPRDIRTIIKALGASRNGKAVAPLSRIAADPEKRKGLEGELGAALADLGDKKSAGLIADMINHVESQEAFFRLLAAYKKLTGREYVIEQRGSGSP